MQGGPWSKHVMTSCLNMSQNTIIKPYACVLSSSQCELANHKAVRLFGFQVRQTEYYQSKYSDLQYYNFIKAASKLGDLSLTIAMKSYYYGVCCHIPGIGLWDRSWLDCVICRERGLVLPFLLYCPIACQFAILTHIGNISPVSIIEISPNAFMSYQMFTNINY